MIKLKIDPEFKAKIPSMTDEQFNGLREDILRDGYVRDPLVVWQEENTLLDGHHRWTIICENWETLKDKYNIDYKSFPNRWAALEWICRNQLNKHNLNDEQITYITGEMFKARKKSEGAQVGNKNAEKQLAQNEPVVFEKKEHGTAAAWRAFNGNTDEPIECRVYRGMSWLDECDAFMRQNKLKKDPTTNDKLKAGYNSKNPDVVDMVEKATLCGFVVDFTVSKTPTRIVATNTLFRAYKMLGGDAFQDMMTAIKDAWYGDMDAVSTHILSGMMMFYGTYYGNFNQEALVKALKRKSPAEIIRYGRQDRNRSNSYTREIVKAYNAKKKYRLDESLL